MIEVAWGTPRSGKEALYPIDVVVEASDRQGLLRDITERGVIASKGQLDRAMKPKKRAELLIEAQRIALEDIPYIPLWWGVAATAIIDQYAIEDFGSYTFVSPWTPRILTNE